MSHITEVVCIMLMLKKKKEMMMKKKGGGDDDDGDDGEEGVYDADEKASSKVRLCKADLRKLPRSGQCRIIADRHQYVHIYICISYICTYIYIYTYNLLSMLYLWVQCR